MAKLKKHGRLSGETAGWIFSAASNQSSTAERQKVTVHMDLILFFALCLKIYSRLESDLRDFFSYWLKKAFSSGLSKLRQLLLQVINIAVQTVPITTPAGVQKAARALIDVALTGSELGSSAVVQNPHTCFIQQSNCD